MVSIIMTVTMNIVAIAAPPPRRGEGQHFGSGVGTSRTEKHHVVLRRSKDYQNRVAMARPRVP